MYNLAVIPGDGIGRTIVPEDVLSRINETHACLFGATKTPVGVAISLLMRLQKQ